MVLRPKGTSHNNVAWFNFVRMRRRSRGGSTCWRASRVSSSGTARRSRSSRRSSGTCSTCSRTGWSVRSCTRTPRRWVRTTCYLVGVTFDTVAHSPTVVWRCVLWKWFGPLDFIAVQHVTVLPTFTLLLRDIVSVAWHYPHLASTLTLAPPNPLQLARDNAVFSGVFCSCRRVGCWISSSSVCWRWTRVTRRTLCGGNKPGRSVQSTRAFPKNRDTYRNHPCLRRKVPKVGVSCTWVWDYCIFILTRGQKIKAKVWVRLVLGCDLTWVNTVNFFSTSHLVGTESNENMCNTLCIPQDSGVPTLERGWILEAVSQVTEIWTSALRVSIAEESFVFLWPRRFHFTCRVSLVQCWADRASRFCFRPWTPWGRAGNCTRWGTCRTWTSRSRYLQPSCLSWSVPQLSLMSTGSCRKKKQKTTTHEHGRSVV